VPKLLKRSNERKSLYQILKYYKTLARYGGTCLQSKLLRRWRQEDNELEASLGYIAIAKNKTHTYTHICMYVFIHTPSCQNCVAEYRHNLNSAIGQM
jgi:hypothetical protein